MPSSRKAKCTQPQPASTAAQYMLPPNMLAWWLMLGVSGNCKRSWRSCQDTTCTPMDWLRGMSLANTQARWVTGLGMVKTCNKFQAQYKPRTRDFFSCGLLFSLKTFCHKVESFIRFIFNREL